MTQAITMNRIRWVKFILFILLVFIIVASLMVLVKPMRPCGIIGRIISDNGCVRSFYNGSSVAFLPDGQTLIREDFRDIVLSSLSYRFWQTEVLEHDDFVKEMALSPDGKIIASMTRGLGAGPTIWLWEVESRTLLHKYSGADASATEVAFSGDGKRLVLVKGYINGIEVRDIDSWELVFATEGQFSAVISPDNSMLATFGKNSVKLIEISTGEVIALLDIAGKNGAYAFGDSLVFSPDGQYLAANSYFGSIFVWRLADHQLIFSDHPYPDRVDQSITDCQLAFSPDSKLIANCYHTRGDYDGFVELYNVEDGALLRTINVGYQNRSVYRPESVSFSPDGALLAVGTPNETMIFSLENLGSAGG